jgi:ankyrin repeat protein
MLRKSLATLPQTLDETYDRILTAINKEDREYAMCILQWLTFSARPLSLKEIAEVVAINVARDPAFDRNEVLEDPLEALNICSSLVTTTKDKSEGRRGPAQRFIVLAHYSVREYLVSDRVKQGQAKQYSMQEVECHKAITKGSLMYLIQIEQLLSTETLETFALARYAAEFWSTHLRRTGDETEGTLLAMGLMSTDKPAFLNWIKLCDPDHPWEGPDLDRGPDTVATPLYYAASLGLTLTTRLLLGKDADVNVQGGVYGNALQVASAEGHVQVVEMLLDKSADLNAQGGHFDTALQAASFRGHEQVVEMLLDKGADVNAQVGHFDNALQAAALQGHKQVVEMLLNKGANVNVQGGYFDDALRAASYGGHEQVVKMLLNRGANVNALGGRYGNALQAASLRGHKEVVEMLLDRGARVNAQAGHYGNALQAASEGGHEQIVKTLLDKGAEVNVNAQGGHYGNALQAALDGGHEQIVKTLLDKGAEVNAQGGFYGNALQAA